MLETAKPKIFVVDDTAKNVSHLRKLLSKLDVDIVVYEAGVNILELAKNQGFSLILIDDQMTTMNAYDIADMLHGHNVTKDIPIIYITEAYNDEHHRRHRRTEIDQRGVIDYIEKPIQDKILLSRVKVLLTFWEMNQKLDGLEQELAEKKSALESEVDQRQQLEAKLDRMAMYDVLTNLPNRALLNNEAVRQLSAAERYGGRVGFMLVDLNGFKVVNDHYGYETADAVLVEISKRLVNAVRGSDIVTRYGGDEFVIILPDCKSKLIVEIIASRILKEIGEPLVSVEMTEKVTASIGISIYPEDATTKEELISLANKAMYEAKEAGNNHFKFAALYC